jgi:cytidylate kinase
MPKLALKLFLTASALHRKHRRTDWYRAITIFSTLVTIGLIALYALQRGMIG